MPRLPLFLLLSAVACAQIVTIPGTQAVSQSRTTLNNNFTYLDGAKVTKFSGAGVPGSIAASKRGDIYLDLTAGTVYSCFAVGPCTAVGVGNWLIVSSVGGGITSLNALTGAVQTFVNDTNVTITSSGTAHTFGWTGLLAVARGGLGLGAPANNQVPVGTSGNIFAFRTLPSCSNGTTDKLLYNNTTNLFTCGVDQTAGGGTGITDLNGLTAASQTLDAVSDTNIALAVTQSSSTNNRITATWASILSVARGGIGVGTLADHGTAIAHGTGAFTATTPGTSGFVWTSTGAGSDPTWQTPFGITSLNGLTTATQTFDAINDTNVNLTITQSSATNNRITATWAGILGVSRGGSGASTLAAHGTVTAQGTGPFTAVTPGTSGFVWTSNGPAADPTWQIGGGGSPGVTSLQGLTGNLNFVTPGTSGTAPAWSGLTLNLPMASAAAVTAGLLNKTDYDLFAGKEVTLSFTSPLVRTTNTITCATCEVTTQKNATNGYAGLASGKIARAQGQEVWTLSDLSDVTATRGNATIVQLAAGAAPATDDCAKFDVNGNIVTAGAPCGGGGGGAVSSVFTRSGAVVSAHRDYIPSQLGCDVLRTSGTVLTIFTGASSTNPCIISIGNTSYTFTAGATVTLSAGAGTGTARIYMASDGTLSAGHNLVDADVTCSGCTKVPAITAYPADSVQLFTWVVTVADTWDATGVDQRAFLSSGMIPIAGTGLSSSDSGGKRTFSIGASTATFGLTAVTFSATPTFTATTTIQTFTITLTGNVTSSTLAGASTGGMLNFKICQDGTGGRTLAWPANFKGATAIGATASQCSLQTFMFEGTSAFGMAVGQINIAP